MNLSVSELARFVPRFIRRRLVLDPSPPKKPVVERFPGVIGFADISGFTELSTRLAERGPEGAEELNRVLSQYYAALVDTVLDSGGDVIAFAGDAALIAWEAADDGEGLRQTLLRACVAAEDIVRLPKERQLAPGIRLAEKVTISCGELQAAEIGGVDGFWQPVVVGKPLRELRAATDMIQSDEVILAPSAAVLAGESVEGTRREPGHLVLKRINASPEPVVVAPPVLPDEAPEALRCYVAPAVCRRLEAGRFDWLAELRQATVIFGEFDVKMEDPDVIDQLQRIMVVHQETLMRYEGTMVQLIADDKGTASLCCFGLPPLQHENDAPRAVRAAQEIHAELKRIGVRAGLGLSTGRIFCGPRGSIERRCEYAVTGDVVVRASRIMSRADNGIFCDKTTREGACRFVSFEAQDLLDLKGIARPVAVFTPSGLRTTRVVRTEEMVGRGPEMEIIGNLLDQLVRARGDEGEGSGGVIFLEGEPGIGKSVIIDAAIKHAESREIAVLFGESNAIESATPYFIWRSVLSGFLGIDPAQSSVFQRETAMARLKSCDPELEELAPLLNAILPVGFPESDLVSQMDDQLRADLLHNLVVRIIEEFSRRVPVLVVLDDGHWIDSSSWELASQVARRVPRLSLIVAMRPMREPIPGPCRVLSEAEGFQSLKVEKLGEPDIRRIAENALGVEGISQRLSAFLYERSLGNPFFGAELSIYLRDAGYLQMDASPWELRESELERARNEVPSTIRALVTTRIDDLPFEEQLTMKAASVIGLQFSKNVLLAIHPSRLEEGRIAEHLLGMLQRELAQILTGEPQMIYVFRHVTIQQVTYDQLTIAQRKPLHRAIARWYEEVMGPESSGSLPLLAYHWSRAGDAEKEMHYLELAGKEALRQYANHEASRCFSDALERHLEFHGDRLDRDERLRRANWERLLGEALFRIGDLPAARTHLENCLTVLNHRLQAQKKLLVFFALGQITVQASHRAVLPHPKLADESVIDQDHEIALACQRLSQVHYLQADMALGFTRSVRGMNHAERHGLTAVLARAYAGTSVAIGMMGGFRIAEFYARLSEDAARRAGQLQTLAYVLMATGLYRMSVAQWDRNRKALEEAVAVCEKLGDNRQLTECVTVQAMQACLQGDYAEGQRLYARVGDLAQQTENRLHRAWSFSGRAEATFRLGDLDQAVRLAETSLDLLRGQSDLTEVIRLNGIVALSHWRSGRKEEGMEWMERTVEAIRESRFATVTTLEGFAAVVEICQAMEDSHPGESKWRQTQQEILSIMTRNARGYPVWRPRVQACRGVIAWRSGHRGRALKRWNLGIRLAETLDLPLELGVVHREAARALDREDPRREEHLDAARRAFERTGAKGDLELAEGLS